MVKLLVCGDFVCQNPQELRIDGELKSLMQQQDFVAVNFEAPIRGYGRPIYKSGPSLTQSADSPALLEDLGVNVVLLANNHMMDQGREGCDATISQFRSSTILGAGSFDDAYNFSVLEKEDLRIGLLAVVHKEFGALGIDSQSGDYGTAWINHPKVNQIVLSARKECDVLIVLPHAGVEDVVVPLPEWRARYKEFIDLGADAVIASHPHTPQGWEEYKGKKIFYSLGNFYFKSLSSSHTENWYKGLVVQITINGGKELHYDVINTRFTDTSLSIDNTKEAKEYSRYLCELLADHDKYQAYLKDALTALWPEYKLYLLRGLAAIAPTTNMHVLLHAGYGVLKGPDNPMLINNFQCESHRWAIERILNTL